MRSPLTTAAAIAVITFFTCCNSASSKPPAGRNKGIATESADPSGSGNPSSGKAAGLIDWQVRADHTYYLRDAANDPYLYISLKSGESEECHNRPPLNISLVLDRSGSMAGEKIAYLRRAAKFVIDQLDSRDILSIVNYDNVVEVMSPSAPVRNKEALKGLIDRLTDRGNTNLSGGMLEGYTQVAITKREGYINRVLLLTDGLANEGIIDPARLKAIVQKKLRSDGIAISTFGLGAGYNEDLLTGMAEVGGANYYFIDKAERIP